MQKIESTHRSTKRTRAIFFRRHDELYGFIQGAKLPYWGFMDFGIKIEESYRKRLKLFYSIF